MIESKLFEKFTEIMCDDFLDVEGESDYQIWTDENSIDIE